MRRHALVVGAQIGNLTGVHYDCERMCATLANRGFEVDLRLGPAASRAGILAGYDHLIGRVRRDDAAVIYFSGHGLYAFNRDRTDELQTVQAIAPTDLDATTEHDFRGITAWELAIKLAQLTAMTRNVTVLLDCCHAAQMTRDAAAHDLVPRALPNPIDLGFRAHLAALEAAYGAVSIHPIGNPYAVRVVACGQSQGAFEHTNALGKRSGIFTQALLDLFAAVGDTPVSWAELGDALRHRVKRHHAFQRPEVEGPAERRLFSTDVVAPCRVIAVAAVAPATFRLHAGWVHGLSPGDRCVVLPLGAERRDDARAIATVRITDTSALASTAELVAWAPGHAAVPDDAVAIPLARAAPRHAVHVVAPPAARAAITRALADSEQLTADADPSPIATLRLAADRLTIEDAAGPLYPAAPYPDQLATAIHRLGHLAAARQLRAAVGEHGLAGDTLAITWGKVVAGAAQPLAEHGAQLVAGERIYVRVHNRDPLDRFVHVLNIGVRGKITSLTKAIAPAGVPLTRGAHYTLGEHHGVLRGLGVTWPADLPFTGAPRSDELLVVVTALPINLHGLETHDTITRGAAAPAMRGEALLVKRLAYWLRPS
ncbi:MAG TPA: caspase family protein [Kofleriaceae bacterium]|nr:caspase family protein [Kofleriaceae bacterium]